MDTLHTHTHTHTHTTECICTRCQIVPTSSLNVTSCFREQAALPNNSRLLSMSSITKTMTLEPTVKLIRVGRNLHGQADLPLNSPDLDGSPTTHHCKVKHRRIQRKRTPYQRSYIGSPGTHCCQAKQPHITEHRITWYPLQARKRTPYTTAQAHLHWYPLLSGQAT